MVTPSILGSGSPCKHRILAVCGTISTSLLCWKEGPFCYFIISRGRIGLAGYP
jgi:hypothetical protein